MKTKLDTMIFGILAGLIGGVIGFFIYHLIMASISNADLIYSMINAPSSRAPILSVSIFFNIAVFFLFMRYTMYKAGRGVILSMFLYGTVIVYYKFFI